jgi:hypothetical protein
MTLLRTAGLAALTSMACHAAIGAWGSSVFCSASAGAQVLAIAMAPEGKLRFGISVWSPKGGNISVFGVAKPTAGGWRYAEKDGRCVINLARSADGGFTIRADTVADCRAHGGEGTRIGTLHFTPTQNEGPVTTQLDDAETFQHAGRCAGGQATQQSQ